MRSSLGIVLVILAVLGITSAQNGVARAQVQGPTSTLPAVYTLLKAYTLPQSALPQGSIEVGIQENDNVSLVAQDGDPTAAQNVVARGRIDGIEQDLILGGHSGNAITLDLELFRDSAGASADVQDLSGLQGSQVTSLTPPSLGDSNIAAHIASPARSGGAPEGVLVGFSSGRLEVNVIEQGSTGSVSEDDVLPLAKYVASAVASNPVPAPSDAELALLRTEADPEQILYDAYDFLLQNYLTQLNPSDLLTGAFMGAAKALTDKGVTSVPAAPQITSQDADGAWAQFLPAYQALEATSTAVSRQDLEQAAATSMYGSLNCHTEYFPPQLYTRVYAEINGQPEALIGIVWQPRPPYTILRVLPNSPAERAGLKAGDQILAFDHVTPDDVGEKNFLQLGIGDAGTPLTITVQRPGVDQPFDVTAVRELLSTPNVTHKMLPGGIGYVELDAFTDGPGAVDDVRAALKDFASAGNVNGWILDLRNNSGGSAATMAQLAGLFVQPGSILGIDIQQDGTSDIMRSSGTPPAGQQPMVILTGPGTASAAEIFTQAMKDLHRATIVGSQTAGCVNGGQIYGLLDSSGIFVSEIDVLSGPRYVPLEGVGVSPDEQVDSSDTDLITGNDPQLAAAEALFTGSAAATASTGP